MSPSAGTNENPFMSRFISMILIASSRGISLAMKDVHLALDEIIHHQLFAGQLFVEMEDVDHVAVRILQRHHVRAVGGGRQRDRIG